MKSNRVMNVNINKKINAKSKLVNTVKGLFAPTAVAQLA